MTPIREHKKTATLRKGIRDYTLGSAVIISAADSSDSIPIWIVKLELVSLNKLTDVHAKNENYNTVEELKNALLLTYPDLTGEDILTLVGFTVQ